MSDKPQGPGWWLASDGTWHPPELHPSMREDTAVPVDTVPPPTVRSRPVPEASNDAPVATVEMPPMGPVGPRPVPSLPGAPKRPAWSGESDRRPESGPMFPDLFEQAVAGSRLASAVTVHYSDGEHAESFDFSTTPGPSGPSEPLVSAGGRAPVEVGAFSGASAKKRRWRL